MAYSQLALANVSVTAKGAKMAVLTDGAERCYYTFPAPSSCPFGPAAFFDGLDAWAVDYLCAHSKRLFKQNLSLAQVHDMYHPCLRKAPDYEPLLRTKYNTPSTRGACRFWTAGGEEREPPADWRDAELTPHVHVSHLWMMGSSCGLVINVCDMLVTEASRAFPFGQPMAD
jgi:hypothetical protein